MKSVEIILTQNNIKIKYKDFKKHIEKEFNIYELSNSIRAMIYAYLFYDKLYRELDDLIDVMNDHAIKLSDIEDHYSFVEKIRDTELDVIDILTSDEVYKTLEMTRKYIAHELDSLEREIAEAIRIEKIENVDD